MKGAWGFPNNKMSEQAAGVNCSFSGVGTHRISLLFSRIVLPALPRLPLNTVPPFQPLMGSDSAGIASHRWFPQLRRVAQPPKVFVLTPVFLRENVRCKVKGVFRWHKKRIGWTVVIQQPVQAGRSCVCLTNWTYIWRTGRSTMSAAFLRRKCRWARCWTHSLWKKSTGRHESRQIAQWNLRRCDGIIKS